MSVTTIEAESLFKELLLEINLCLTILRSKTIDVAGRCWRWISTSRP